jgi:hypothetical protein
VIVITGPFWQYHLGTLLESASVGQFEEVFAKRELNILRHLSETVLDLRVPMKRYRSRRGALSRCSEPETSVTG